MCYSVVLNVSAAVVNEEHILVYTKPEFKAPSKQFEQYGVWFFSSVLFFCVCPTFERMCPQVEV